MQINRHKNIFIFCVVLNLVVNIHYCHLIENDDRWADVSDDIKEKIIKAIDEDERVHGNLQIVDIEKYIIIDNDYYSNTWFQVLFIT
ncbi:hypothetical protein HZS_6177 [Henneguya salminicola]|nr:hypothetical protein HZS_6177 [Henneguya salminicola]